VLQQLRQLLMMMLVCDCADCAREDSGNYTCEVRGKRSSILAAVTHHLYIRGTTRYVIRQWPRTAVVEAVIKIWPERAM